MSNPLIVTYGGIDVAYLESENVWLFTLRGRDRKTESLAKAKEAIDKPVKEDKPQFDPVRCYTYRWDSWIIGNVTSVASDRSWDEKNKYVWFVSEKDKQRTKENSSQLFPVNEKSTAAVNEFNSLTDEINNIKLRRDKVHASMEKLKIT